MTNDNQFDYNENFEPDVSFISRAPRDEWHQSFNEYIEAVNKAEYRNRVCLATIYVLSFGSMIVGGLYGLAKIAEMSEPKRKLEVISDKETENLEITQMK